MTVYNALFKNTTSQNNVTGDGTAYAFKLNETLFQNLPLMYTNNSPIITNQPFDVYPISSLVGFHLKLTGTNLLNNRVTVNLVTTEGTTNIIDVPPAGLRLLDGSVTIDGTCGVVLNPTSSLTWQAQFNIIVSGNLTKNVSIDSTSMCYFITNI